MKFRAGSGAEGKRQSREQRSHGRHHNGPETHDAGLIDGVFGRLVFFALRIKSEVNHHDGVFLDDADQQQDADQGDDVQVVVREQESEESSNTSRGQRGKDRYGMDITFIQNSEHDVDSRQGGCNQDRLARERALESCRGALKAGMNSSRQVDFPIGSFDELGGFSERNTFPQIERNGDRRKLSLMINGERRIGRLVVTESGQGNHRARF